MGHSHGPHDHSHTHSHEHSHDAPLDAAADLSIPDDALAPRQLGRRNVLRAAGVLGVGAATTSLATANGTATAAAEGLAPGRRRPPQRGYTWLAGDHHIHTQYSPDGLYTVEDQVKHGDAFGLDWMVITDHGGAQHARIGVEKVNPDIRASRERHPEVLIFQGLEWNIPAAEHGTVFVHPGRNEVAVLKAFEQGYDGSVNSATGNSPVNEALAVKGIQFLKSAVSDRRVQDALMFANHPARQGIDSPHEVRAWRDAAKGIAMGWEGAPGHQAAGISKAAMGPGAARGYYGNAPKADRSHMAYPLESYRTWGGFDFYTATVGGLWDSLLAEGKPWWITANSDSHSNYLDTAMRGEGSDFANNGYYNDPVYSGKPNTEAGDYWPGFYSRTHVGTRKATYAGVMAGMRDGNIWVDHGHLIEEVDVRVRVGSQIVGLGGVATGKRGASAEIRIRIVPAQHSNWAQFVPQLARLDLIKGMVTGPVTDKDVFHTPDTRVEKTWDVRGRDVIEIVYNLGRIEDRGFFVRLRGSDGNRNQAGYYPKQDPNGPAMDVEGDADPWKDLWFYTNPVFVLPRK
ncbi:PHP domain-containing protein [Actinomycetota bacterium]